MRDTTVDQYTATSLFSGCGGSDLGLIDAGIRPIYALDSDPAACIAYRAVTGHDHIVEAPIESVRDFPSADILVGCYPCQGYSQAGVRKSSDSRNYLYREFDRALRQIRPRAFIVENVDGMRFSQNAHLLRAQLVRFRLAGYRVSVQLLNAQDYGVAQHRRRLFLVGVASDLGVRYQFPEPTHGPGRTSPYVTIRDAIGHMGPAAPGSYDDEPLHWYYMSRNRRRDWDEQAPCVVAHWRHVGLHPSSPPLRRLGPDRWEFVRNGPARRFSYQECAALQGFPDVTTFEALEVPVRAKFRVIGNSVPPPMFAAVANRLRALLAASGVPSRARQQLRDEAS